MRFLFLTEHTELHFIALTVNPLMASKFDNLQLAIDYMFSKELERF